MLTKLKLGLNSKLIVSIACLKLYTPKILRFSMNSACAVKLHIIVEKVSQFHKVFAQRSPEWVSRSHFTSRLNRTRDPLPSKAPVQDKTFSSAGR